MLTLYKSTVGCEVSLDIKVFCPWRQVTQRLPMHLRWPSLGLKPYQELQICGICSKVELVLHRISTQCDKQPGLIPSLFSFIRISTSCKIKTIPDREILVPLRNSEQILDFTTKAFFFWRIDPKFLTQLSPAKSIQDLVKHCVRKSSGSSGIPSRPQR